jgi:hypothetical protein
VSGSTVEGEGKDVSLKRTSQADRVSLGRQVYGQNEGRVRDGLDGRQTWLTVFEELLD